MAQGGSASRPDGTAVTPGANADELALVVARETDIQGGMATQHGEAEDIVSSGITPQEIVAYSRLKTFCANIIKRLAPPLIKEVQASSLRPEAEPFNPRRRTRATKRASSMANAKATPTENVLLRAMGLVPDDMVPDELVVTELKDLFDSPLREQHERVIAAIFGKSLPRREDLAGDNGAVISVH